MASLVLVYAAGLAASAAVERFPPPDFGADYVYPSSSQAPGRLGWLAWLDLLILIAALGLATAFVHRLRSRRAILWLSIGSLIYFGFYRKGCVCPIGAIQNVSQALFDSSYVVPLTVLAFFAVPLLFALFAGRVFCGGVCPLGALQDLVLLKSVTIPRWLGEGLSLIRYGYLGLAVLFAATASRYVICEYDPFVSFFRMAARWHIWIWSGALLLTSLFVGRPYCRFLCPYGALLGIFSRFSTWRVSISPDKCITCHLCRESCAFGAIREGRRRGGEEAA